MNLILWLSAIVFVADQATKLTALHYLVLNRSVPFIPDFFNMTLVFNTGAAFGIMINQTAVLVVISIITICTLLIFGYIYAAEGGLFRVSVALILGGAVGNLFDRLVRGYVVDFLDFYFRQYHWPAFNVADSCICVGTFLLALYFLKTNNGHDTKA